MARIAATEDVEGVRDEENLEDDPVVGTDMLMDAEDHSGAEDADTERHASARPETRKRKYVATVQEVHDAFDSLNVLRYSQPCHLQGV
jgi:cleavage and polyadenylation specificity factor subunit 2